MTEGKTISQDQVLSTQAILVSGINSLLVLVFFMGFVDNEKNIE